MLGNWGSRVWSSVFFFFFLSAKCRVKALLVERLLKQRLKGALLHLTCVHHVECPV